MDEHEEMVLGMIGELAEAGSLPPFPVPTSALVCSVLEMSAHTFVVDRILATQKKP